MIAPNEWNIIELVLVCWAHIKGKKMKSALSSPQSASIRRWHHSMAPLVKEGGWGRSRGISPWTQRAAWHLKFNGRGPPGELLVLLPNQKPTCTPCLWGGEPCHSQPVWTSLLLKFVWIFSTSLLPNRQVGRHWCCFWCNFTIGGVKGWTKNDKEFKLFLWQRRITLLFPYSFAFFINLRLDAARYALLFFPVVLVKIFKVMPYWLFSLYIHC